MAELEYNDYTEEELKSFAKRSWQTNVWGMQRGNKTYWIPIKELKLNHLRNIIVWIKAHPEKYDFRVLWQLEQRLEQLLTTKTENGKLLYAKV